jgi:hypothetical protein
MQKHQRKQKASMQAVGVILAEVWIPKQERDFGLTAGRQRSARFPDTGQEEKS